MKRIPIIMLIFIICATSVFTGAQNVSLTENEKRRILWEAFFKKKPGKILKIDVYGENPSLTAVCFRSMGVTYLFDLRTNRFSPVNHAKLLPKGSVNNIIFLKDKKTSLGAFILSYNGSLQLSISAIE